MFLHVCQCKKYLSLQQQQQQYLESFKHLTVTRNLKNSLFSKEIFPLMEVGVDDGLSAICNIPEVLMEDFKVNEEFCIGWTSSASATFTGKNQVTHQ